jgi:hypothetical protein
LKKLVCFLSPLLLVVVALHQIYLTRAQNLSPWKGGGFGMFSSTELGSARYVRVYVSAPDRSEELQIPESLEDLAAKGAILPSDSMLQNLAKGVVRREERYERPVESVRIEVWRTRFDVVSLMPEGEKLREIVYQVAEISR